MQLKPVSKAELNDLATLSATRASITIAIDIAAVVGLLMLAAWSKQVLVVSLVIILIARQQHALAILIHEGVHRRLFRSRRLNDVAARWLLAGPLFVSFDGYRRMHLRHHAYTMTSDDPDFQFVKDFPMSIGQFSKSVLHDLTGASYLFLLRHYWQGGRKEFRSIFGLLGSAVPPIAVNALLLAACLWNGYAWVYFVCWLAPLFLVFPLLLHVRGICEHGGQEPNPDPLQCTWTVLNPIETFFVAPHNINYHMEHHAFPAVPQFNLPKLHRLLAASGSLPTENIHRSYWTILKTLIVPR